MGFLVVSILLLWGCPMPPDVKMYVPCSAGGSLQDPNSSPCGCGHEAGV